MPSRTYTDHDTGPRSPSIRSFWAVARICGLRPEWVRYDRTRRGWHAVIEWGRDFAPAETVALQAVLGSDSRRECLNLRRALCLDGGVADPRYKHFNLLFARKVKDARKKRQ